MRTQVFVAAVFGSIALGGCAVQSGANGQNDEAQAEAEGAISTGRTSYVSIRHDTRKCISPLCGGFWIRDLDSSAAETYVSGLDFSLSGLDAESQATVHEAPTGELVLRGKLGHVESHYKTRPLMVLAAYRGMPGVSADMAGTFFTVAERSPKIECFAAPCNNVVAKELNTGTKHDITRLSVDEVGSPLLDETWLASRVFAHGAIVGGKLVNGALYPAGYETVLSAAQVFVRIPEKQAACPMYKLAACPTGEVRTFTRDENRCQVPSDCVKPGICPLYLPACGDGYQLASWPGGTHGCSQFACDPKFTY